MASYSLCWQYNKIIPLSFPGETIHQGNLHTIICYDSVICLLKCAVCAYVSVYVCDISKPMMLSSVRI